MIDLHKTTKLAKELAEQFGDTPEGAGYRMLYQMLIAQGGSKPRTFMSIDKEIKKYIEDHGIPGIRYNLSVEKYSYSGDIRFELSLYEMKAPTIETESVSKLLQLAHEAIREEAPAIIKKRQENAHDTDVTV